MKITGAKSVIAAIDKWAKKEESERRARMRKAVLLVRRRSQLIVPVDTGNLRASAFTRVDTNKKLTTGYIGYTASYAAFVHERLKAKHGRGKSAKFLEKPLQESVAEIAQILGGK